MSIGASPRDARIAAALYFAWFIMAVVRAIYIPVSLFFQGNATARILEHEATFRLAMLTDLTAAVLMVFVALALYRLLAPVNRARESHGHSPDSSAMERSTVCGCRRSIAVAYVFVEVARHKETSGRQCQYLLRDRVAARLCIITSFIIHDPDGPDTALRMP